MLTESAYQTLNRVALIKEKDARREALRFELGKRPALAMAVQYAYHPDVQFDLPEGPLPGSMFKPSGHEDFSIFYTNVKKLRHFFTSSPVRRVVKENNFAGLCSDVAGSDALLLMAIKDKKLPWKTLNKSFVVKAIPELFPPAMPTEPEEDE